MLKANIWHISNLKLEHKYLFVKCEKVYIYFTARVIFDSTNPTVFCEKVLNTINFVRVHFPELFPFIRPRNKICFVHYFPTDVTKCITIEKMSR